MAFATRLLSKSKQLQGAQIVLHREHVVPDRLFANEATTQPLPQSLVSIARKGDEMLKAKFLEYLNKFRVAMSVVSKEKITIDPDDPAAVSHYANIMKTAREKAGYMSQSQRVAFAIRTRTKCTPDVRSYLSALKNLRIERGLDDSIGAEKMMFDALEEVEKELQKPLMRDNKEGMALLQAKFAEGNNKLGIKPEDLPELEDKVEHGIAKEQLAELKKNCIETMEAYKRRPEFSDSEVPDVRDLDVRNFM